MYPQKWLLFLVLLGFCIFFYFPNLTGPGFRHSLESRYAQVAQEMVNRGDWILMHINGQVYSQKPPLLFWLIAFSSRLWGGFNSFSVRFPSALMATFTVLLTFLLGKNLYGSRIGFFSGLILATSIEFAFLSVRANIDTTLTFFATASLFCFIQWYQWSRREDGPQVGSRQLLIYGFYTGMALATLTKGPVGFILPLLVSLIYLVVQKDWRGLREMRLPSGMSLFLIIVLSWYVAAILRGGQEYLDQTLFYQTMGRYLGGWSHKQSVYFYFINFPLDFLPWALFFPGAIFYGYCRETVEKRKEFSFLLLWFIIVFLFFSFSKGKRHVYLLPLYPAASLMVGKLWADLISNEMQWFRREWIYLPLFVLIGLVLIAGLIIICVVSKKLPSYELFNFFIGFFMVGASVSLLFSYRFKRWEVIFFLIVLMTTVGFFHAVNIRYSSGDQLNSAKSFFTR
jgi:4-amino-4-deoxy-L-arabinose transferase-like glycosyltransferase